MKKIKKAENLLRYLKEGWQLGTYNNEWSVIQRGRLGYGGKTHSVDTQLVINLVQDINVLLKPRLINSHLTTYTLE